MRSIRSSRVALDELRPATITVSDGVIVEIGDGPADDDFGDLVILPGLVDCHVHVNEPGRTEWEGFHTATRAALAGGTTTIVDMPLNSIPPTVTVEALEEKRAAARDQIGCDVGFWGGIVPGSSDQVESLEKAGVCGFKVFMTDSGVPEFPPIDDPAALGGLDTPLLVHAEEPDLLRDPIDASYQAYLASRPPGAEAAAIERLHRVPGPVHVLHVSSEEAVDAIVRGPSTMSAETCPHYLTFTTDDVGEGATQFKCAPPIRERHHREALWDALKNGVITMVVSDHSPSLPEMKEGDFATAWGGISSVQLRLAATWTAASERGFEMLDLARWLALEPARLSGLEDRKGSTAVGKDADFVVFDPDATTYVRASELLHRHPLTPYDGMTLRGRVVDTMLGRPARMLARK